MSASSLIESRTVYSGQAPGTAIVCGVSDTMMANASVTVVFFFERALDEDRLADGLARALARVPTFAGRIRSSGETLEIVCDDQGVPMTTAEAGQTMAEAIGRVTLPGSGLGDHVDAPAGRAGGQPLFRVRVSRLSDGGTALGCSYHHVLGDMRTFISLMRAWSAAVEGTQLPDVQLVSDMDAYLDSMLPPEDQGRPGIRLLEPDEAARLESEIGSAIMSSRTVQIYFGDAEVSRMRDELSASAGQRLSTNDVLCAHVVTTIRRLDEDLETRSFVTAVDIRRRIGIPLAVVGNLTNEVYISCAAGTPPEQFAAQIRAAVGEFEQSHLSIRSSRAFVDSVGRSRISECVPVGFDLSRRTFSFNSWTRFGLYDISFDGQRPVFFSPAPNIALPWISWMVEGFGNTGLLFTVGVPAKLAGRMRSADGRAALHRYRDPDDELPALAAAARKMI